MKTLLTIALLSLAVVSTARAQSKWPKKPYTEWTLQEVTQLLYNSQWAETTWNGVATQYRSDVPDRPPGTEIFIQLQLYSALPVRQAIVRRMQLTIPYDKLTANQRKSFDEEVDGLLKCPHCAQYYIVTLKSSKGDRLNLVTRGSAVRLDLIDVLKRVPLEELQQHVSLLNDNGERRTATRVVFTPRNEAVFLFRRVDEAGKPLITTTNKKFYVEFDDYLSKKAEEALKKFTFNVSDLVHDGEVVF